MSLQIIRSLDGKDEYVLLPMTTYRVLQDTIDKLASDEYVEFNMADYIDNPVALARIKANLTQEELAELLNVSQAYISKIENQSKVSAKLLLKVKKILKGR